MQGTRANAKSLPLPPASCILYPSLMTDRSFVFGVDLDGVVADFYGGLRPIAAEWLGVKTVVPMHYATFPELTGTPDQLRKFMASRAIEVVELRPGQTAS